MTTVEICIDDVEGAPLAEACGAHRVEVCAALSEGGTTPSIGLVALVLARVRTLAVSVLVRPRAGDFVYSPAEIDVMCADIAAVRARSGHFHRAFDTLPDLPAALEVLIGCGVRRVLTSGGAVTAREGADTLRRLVDAAAGRIVVMAGGSVRGENAADLVARTGVPAVHLRAAEPVGAAGTASATAVSFDDAGGRSPPRVPSGTSWTRCPTEESRPDRHIAPMGHLEPRHADAVVPDGELRVRGILAAGRRCGV